MMANLKRKYYLLFIRPSAIFTFAVFNRCIMQQFPALGLSCLEQSPTNSAKPKHAGVRLTGLRKLTAFQRLSLEQRASATRAWLRNHVGEHVVNREFGAFRVSVNGMVGRSYGNA
jgi:hypothetical protein